MGLLCGISVSPPVLCFVTIASSLLGAFPKDLQVLLEVVPCPSIIFVWAVAPKMVAVFQVVRDAVATKAFHWGLHSARFVERIFHDADGGQGLTSFVHDQYGLGHCFLLVLRCRCAEKCGREYDWLGVQVW